MQKTEQGRARETFASSEGGDLSGFSPDVVDDGVLEPGDPGDTHTYSLLPLTITVPQRQEALYQPQVLIRRVPEVETFSENHVHLDPSDPVEDDGPLSSFNCNTHKHTQV